MDLAKQIEYNRRLLVEDIFRRLEASLQPLVDAVNDFFAVLFSRRLPADWREQWRALIAQQEAAGYRIDPRSVQEYEDWIEAWARYCELLPVAETHAVSVAPTEAKQPPADRRALPRPTQTQIREQFFDQKLADAQGSLDEIKRLLDELGGRLDAAKLDEAVDVDADVERCEEQIWRYNDSLISARAAWLRDDLSGEANVRLLQMLTPASFGLPLFSEEQQAQEAMRQERQISERLGQRNVTMDRVVSGTKVAEWTITGVGIVAGGGVLVTAFKSGGKWAVVKALAVAAAAAAAEQGVEAGLRAAGASEETVRGARLAAIVIAFILLRRKNRVASETAESPPPSQPQATAKPPTGKVSPQSDPPKTASGPEAAIQSSPARPSVPGETVVDALHNSPGIIRGENPTRITFQATEVRAVRDLSHVDERTLRTMQQKGFAARDKHGQSLHLHHLDQKPSGPLVEMPATRHSIGNQIQHPLGNRPKAGLTPEQRKAFDQFRIDYWRARATEELQRRGVL